ncbi:NAD-dependent epimerase/dehydratase family protein [Bacillus spongiae]|uniref:NAD-dependent epimerase/dehydratase family protein n=1 Tax=Bacillus spongiae TaxID=2683610 RepID=A0ABU8HCP6_9BACI
MKVLITGGAGFIGSHIADLFINRGFEVIIVDNLSSGDKTNVPNNAKFYELDILSPDLEDIFTTERPDVVIHEAAQVDVNESILNPVQDAEKNILATIQLLENSRKTNVKKFLYSSSCAVYGDTKDVSITEDFPLSPLSFYGLSKWSSEEYIKIYSKLYGLPYTIFRYANVYGPRQKATGEGGVVAIFSQKLVQKEQLLIYGDGNQTRDFVYVKDVARANLLALTKGDHHIINISTNTKTRINDLLTLMARIHNIKVEPSYQAKKIGDIVHSRLHNEQAKSQLDWIPHYSLQQGLSETLTYFQSL